MWVKKDKTLLQRLVFFVGWGNLFCQGADEREERPANLVFSRIV